MWDYDWLGYGLLIKSPGGEDIFLQGDDASTLHDELEACETSDQQQILLSQYDVLLDG